MGFNSQIADKGKFFLEFKLIDILELSHVEIAFLQSSVNSTNQARNINGYENWIVRLAISEPMVRLNIKKRETTRHI